MIEKDDKNYIIKTIKQYLPECTVYLFGSRAREDARVSSDIDLALDVGEKIDFHVLCRIKDDLEDSTIPFFIDVIDIHDVDEKFLNAIKKNFVKLEE